MSEQLVFWVSFFVLLLCIRIKSISKVSWYWGVDITQGSEDFFGGECFGRESHTQGTAHSTQRHRFCGTVVNIKILDKTFEHDDKLLDRKDKALDIWFDLKVEPFNVSLLLNSDAIVYLERKPIKGQYLKKNYDGTGKLTVSLTNKREIFTVLKKWLPQIKVIEPMDLQEEFEDILQGYLVKTRNLII